MFPLTICCLNTMNCEKETWLNMFLLTNFSVPRNDTMWVDGSNPYLHDFVLLLRSSQHLPLEQGIRAQVKVKSTKNFKEDQLSGYEVWTTTKNRMVKNILLPQVRCYPFQDQ